jgi:hypothetical protein
VAEPWLPPPLPARPPASSAPPKGFAQSEAIRIGGAAAIAPTDCVGLVVVVRTPQRVRLGQVTVLKQARNILGRGRGVGCFLDDPGAAEFHAAVVHRRAEEGPGFFLYSAGAAPVAINGSRAGAVTRLRSGDRIEIGATELVFFQTELETGRGE